jgi:hypothetical protein
VEQLVIGASMPMQSTPIVRFFNVFISSESFSLFDTRTSTGNSAVGGNAFDEITRRGNVCSKTESTQERGKIKKLRHKNMTQLIPNIQTSVGK